MFASRPYFDSHDPLASEVSRRAFGRCAQGRCQSRMHLTGERSSPPTRWWAMRWSRKEEAAFLQVVVEVVLFQRMPAG